jgi:hypothetical protein
VPQLETIGDLSLNAGNELVLRDSVDSCLDRDAGGDLTLSALNGIDILALNHADSEIESGGDLTLQSDGIISGDAHYFSIGNFIIAPITPGQLLVLLVSMIRSLNPLRAMSILMPII